MNMDSSKYIQDYYEKTKNIINLMIKKTLTRNKSNQICVFYIVIFQPVSQ